MNKVSGKNKKLSRFFLNYPKLCVRYKNEKIHIYIEMISLENTWIKAAVEKRIIIVDYFDREEKQVMTNIEIEPYYFCVCDKDIKKGLFGIKKNGKSLIIDPDSITNLQVKEEKFTPKHHSKEYEIEKIYKKKDLKYKRYPMPVLEVSLDVPGS